MPRVTQIPEGIITTTARTIKPNSRFCTVERMVAISSSALRGFRLLRQAQGVNGFLPGPKTRPQVIFEMTFQHRPIPLGEQRKQLLERSRCVFAQSRQALHHTAGSRRQIGAELLLE